ncbi:hypothetical protein [Saccharibacillus alkalitolerans]|uniref:DUF4367 domain-containing protein n=1 Tax=Saccharibacillus alkalitolerans TaxID=2705290 RepID=A0ABX0FCK3_9BACL|nr:hypothetical protein [Saccharibacillus alkalitolerans]NGZ77264.1 hypothetical protein [Saccharibacillus alkalitolerans]
MNRKALKTILIPSGALILSASLFFALSNEKIPQSTSPSNPAQAGSATADSQKKNDMKIIKTSSETQIYEASSELEAEADLVVLATASPEIKYVNEEPDENGVPLWYWAETKVEIKNLQKSKEDLGIGEDIMIYEPYTIFTDSLGQQVKIINENYNEIKPNEEYLLFLKKHPDGGYMPLGTYQGKVNISDPVDESNKELSNEAKAELQSFIEETPVE